MDEHGWRKLDPRPPDEHRRVLSQVEAKYAERFGKYEIAQANVNDLRDQLAQSVHVRFGKYEIAQANVNDLRELIALLSAERIPTILVLMPHGPRLRALYARDRLAPLFEEFERL